MCVCVCVFALFCFPFCSCSLLPPLTPTHLAPACSPLAALPAAPGKAPGGRAGEAQGGACGQEGAEGGRQRFGDSPARWPRLTLACSGEGGLHGAAGGKGEAWQRGKAAGKALGCWDAGLQPGCQAAGVTSSPPPHSLLSSMAARTCAMYSGVTRPCACSAKCATMRGSLFSVKRSAVNLAWPPRAPSPSTSSL